MTEAAPLGQGLAVNRTIAEVAAVSLKMSLAMKDPCAFIDHTLLKKAPAGIETPLALTPNPSNQ
jgi:hypothetical protein